MTKKNAGLALVTALALLLGATAPLRAVDIDQMKTDLVGQCMGGREKCWRFRSRDQIKNLAVKSQREADQKRVYTVDLTLSDPHGSGTFAGEARVEYVRAGKKWKIKQVGLLSLRKTTPT